MRNEFLTKGLESDRYLKALQLVEHFENEIETILREFNQRMVSEQPELFDSSIDPELRTRQRSSNMIAYQRINYRMAGPRSRDENQKLNVHLYWVSPNEFQRRDVDGVLRAFGYKIKNADPDIDDAVAEQTRNGDWSIDISGNPYDSNKVFYRHVSSVKEIEEAIEILVDHFSTFGSEYAANSK